MEIFQKMAIAIMCVGLGWGAHSASADPGEHRQRGAHMHGVGRLNLAMEGRELHVELISPAANIVGFEHRPRTVEQRTALEHAMRQLSDGERLFALPAEADCTLGQASVHTELLPAHDGSRSGVGVGEHSADHSHDEEHGEHPEHEHEGEDEAHADIEASYVFGCGEPEKLRYLDVLLFDPFPAMERLEVQFIRGANQGAAELSEKANRVRF